MDRLKFRTPYYLPDPDDKDQFIGFEYWNAVDGRPQMMVSWGKDEQCTGLKDKNGNLIYEGDIVIGRKEIVVCEMIEYKDVVEYKDGAYFPFNWTGVYKPEKFEIIGNVHQIKV